MIVDDVVKLLLENGARAGRGIVVGSWRIVRISQRKAANERSGKE
jgi:hypothetical protein